MIVAAQIDDQQRVGPVDLIIAAATNANPTPGCFPVERKRRHVVERRKCQPGVIQGLSALLAGVPQACLVPRPRHVVHLWTIVEGVDLFLAEVEAAGHDDPLVRPNVSKRQVRPAAGFDDVHDKFTQHRLGLVRDHLDPLGKLICVLGIRQFHGERVGVRGSPGRLVQGQDGFIERRVLCRQVGCVASQASELGVDPEQMHGVVQGRRAASPALVHRCRVEVDLHGHSERSGVRDRVERLVKQNVERPQLVGDVRREPRPPSFRRPAEVRPTHPGQRQCVVQGIRRLTTTRQRAPA